MREATAPTPRVEDDDTPMMQQYQRIKKEHPESILFYRMGDFYEMFNEDARVASKILEIALTSRNKNKANPTAMCGIPHHSAQAYIAKLIKAGKNVAVCEQMEDPRFAKGIVKREVVRVVTPGTVLDDNMLDPKANHFLVSLFPGDNGYGLAALDLTTGLFRLTEIGGPQAELLLKDELDKLDPKEVLIPQNPLATSNPRLAWLQESAFCLRPLEDWSFSHTQAYRVLTEHFKTHSLEGFGCETWKRGVSAAGALIQYLRDTQKSALEHVTTLSTFHMDRFMHLDQATVRSLELVQSSDGTRKGTLLDLLDQSLTPMGARTIREWILKPLIVLQQIEERLDTAEEFKNNLILRNDLRTHFKEIFDLERLLGRISLSACSPRDLTALKSSLLQLPAIGALINQQKTPALSRQTETWDDLEDVYRAIHDTLADEPPFNIKDGNLIKPGCDPELDRLRSITQNGKTWIAQLEHQEKERTGIPVLKVGYNKIYGYYIEVTKKHADRVPPEFIRKQSLVNAERFISPQLKEYEEQISGAEEKILDLEQQLFQKVRTAVAKEGARIQHMARVIGRLDALLAFAETAHRNDFTRPILDDGLLLKVENGRHPVVERLNSTTRFIPNDTHLDCEDNRIQIITGPNMAGKSTYLRQVALITLMAQMGCFVPAQRAEIGIVDRIFSRVGAQDHLLKGQSTFMVEMNETANILNNATRRSLIILDEIGRGTSTFDGISIAWAIVEYLHRPETIGAKTLFATHYHELTELALVLPGVKNYCVQVKEWNDQIIFLRKIVPGGADKSYGIQVARLAGLPESVLKRAQEVLHNLETGELNEAGMPKIGQSLANGETPEPQQLPLFRETEHPVLRKLGEVSPDELSPKQAMEVLYELTRMLRGSQP
jgi:DNA mismatch repair protein MutS